MVQQVAELVKVRRHLVVQHEAGIDQRVAVGHGLKQGKYDQCFACRYPITEETKQSPLYIKGVACPRCHNKMSEDQRARFSERQKQIALAKQRGELHLGRKETVHT